MPCARTGSGYQKQSGMYTIVQKGSCGRDNKKVICATGTYLEGSRRVSQACQQQPRSHVWMGIGQTAPEAGCSSVAHLCRGQAANDNPGYNSVGVGADCPSA
eukprot:644173-Pelagomonas_calceolata.AAC.1